MVFLASGAYGTGASSYLFYSVVRELRNIRDGFSSSARWLSAAGLLGTLFLLSGCADTGYYAQSVKGHMQLMHAAKPVATWLDDPATPAPLKTRLALAQRIRSFAATDLGLPDNASYHRYADLQRKAVVWNVVAAPPLSLKLKTWCFPVAGCVGYRGYFSEVDAQAEAAALQAQGLEVSVYGVPAYSTLGWMNWAGGDPLLNTFIAYPEGELARLVIHELAHQMVYVQGDTAFNESFATAVERIGGARWLATHASDAVRQEYATLDTRRTTFRALTRDTRKALAVVYDPAGPLAGDPAAQAAQKAVVMDNFRAAYQRLRVAWGADNPRTAGYDAWVARANNATFGAQGAYDDLVPGFEALFAQLCAGRSDCTDASVSPVWAQFYDAVRQLAALPKETRHEQLKNLTTEPRPHA